MKIFKKLKTSNKEEAKEAIFGFGCVRAKDYDRDKYGHLLLFSLNIKVAKIKKLFIPL